MDQLPMYVSLLFGATTLLTVFFFYKATHHSKVILYCMLGWLLLQTILGLSGFYAHFDIVPPRFFLLLGPPLVLTAVLFNTKNGKRFIDQLDDRYLTLLHVIRVPVELVLLLLYIHNAIPELMTFEGRNFDILSGLSAPFIFYFGYMRNTLSPMVKLVWNFACLGLLINIVTHAILAAPFPFQQTAFDQPNLAVFYFPFVWLPGLVVPLVLFSQLTCIRRELQKLYKMSYI